MSSTKYIINELFILNSLIYFTLSYVYSLSDKKVHLFVGLTSVREHLSRRKMDFSYLTSKDVWSCFLGNRSRPYLIFVRPSSFSCSKQYYLPSDLESFVTFPRFLLSSLISLVRVNDPLPSVRDDTYHPL